MAVQNVNKGVVHITDFTASLKQALSFISEIASR